MKKYAVFSKQTLNNISDCFADDDEMIDFIRNIDSIADEETFLRSMRNRVSEDDSLMVMMRQICMLALFCRNNWDVIQQIVSKIEIEEIDESQIKKYLGYNDY